LARRVVESPLPFEVRDLVVRRLNSMEEIEVLLLLAGEPAGLRAEAIRERLRLPASALPLDSLKRLVATGLVKHDGEDAERFCYGVADAATRRAVDLLRVAYNERPVTLVRLVYNRPSVAQTFADAFRVKREDQP
jgi:hypothetical protein